MFVLLRSGLRNTSIAFQGKLLFFEKGWVGIYLLGIELSLRVFAACRVGVCLGSLLDSGDLGLEFYEVTAGIHDSIIGALA